MTTAAMPVLCPFEDERRHWTNASHLDTMGTMSKSNVWVTGERTKDVISFGAPRVVATNSSNAAWNLLYCQFSRSENDVQNVRF